MDIVVGIDVSKSWLDVAVVPSGKAFHVANSHAGMDDLLGRLRSVGAYAVALEAIGGYEMLAAAGKSTILAVVATTRRLPTTSTLLSETKSHGKPVDNQDSRSPLHAVGYAEGWPALAKASRKCRRTVSSCRRGCTL